jgi:hypothetical protein
MLIKTDFGAKNAPMQRNFHVNKFHPNELFGQLRVYDVNGSGNDISE